MWPTKSNWTWSTLLKKSEEDRQYNGQKKSEEDRQYNGQKK
jgi:hypothetical protein